jgi:hypothetical protein
LTEKRLLQKEMPLSAECNKIQEFALNLAVSLSCYSLSLELSELDDIKTLRDLVKKRPDLASLLKAISIIQDERGISC